MGHVLLLPVQQVFWITTYLWWDYFDTFIVLPLHLTQMCIYQADGCFYFEFVLLIHYVMGYNYEQWVQQVPIRIWIHVSQTKQSPRHSIPLRSTRSTSSFTPNKSSNIWPIPRDSYGGSTLVVKNHHVQLFGPQPPKKPIPFQRWPLQQTFQTVQITAKMFVQLYSCTR